MPRIGMGLEVVTDGFDVHPGSCHVGYRGGKKAASPGEQRSREPVNTDEDRVYHSADHLARPAVCPTMRAGRDADMTLRLLSPVNSARVFSRASSRSVSYGEPFDPQRVGPPYELTLTAESKRSRRFAFAAFSARIAAGSLLSGNPVSCRRIAEQIFPTPVASPPILPASADAGSRAPRVTMTGPLVGLRPSPCQP